MKSLFTKSIKVKTDSENRLVLDHATKFVLDGKWSLTEDHGLNFKVTSAESYLEGKNLIFHGEIEETTGNSIKLRIRQSQPLSGVKSGAIELKGKWQADANNRICFLVSKGEGRYDTLRFQGSWKVNKNNELIYNYKKTYLKTKVKELQTITFKGYWKFFEHKLIYRLDKSSDSSFKFKAEIASPKITAGSKWIKYSVGVKYASKRTTKTTTQLITVYGKWKLTYDLKVVFEVSYLHGKRKETIFGIEKLIAHKTSIALTLRDKSGKPLGIELTFKKAFENDAELFVALSHVGEEVKIEGGVSVKF